MTLDLFRSQELTSQRQPLAEGAIVLRGFVAAQGATLLDAVAAIAACSPFRKMTTRSGRSMSAAMTNAGALGWVSDARGYRYDAIDPTHGETWPAIPPVFLDVAARAAAEAGFTPFTPDACLVNEYEPGARMGLHQDRDELDLAQPIVSVSLGLPIVFLFGGLDRGDRPERMMLEHGDVVVFGGPARLRHHGVAPLRAGVHPLTGARRINLTFRRAR